MALQYALHAKSKMHVCVCFGTQSHKAAVAVSPVLRRGVLQSDQQESHEPSIRLRPTAIRRDAPRRPHIWPRTQEAALCLLQKRSCAREKTGACGDPRQHIRLDTEGQPPPAASASRRPTTSRSGTARHHRSDRQPNRGSPSTSRTNLRHRRAPHKRTRQKHRRRSRAFPASISWPPMNQTCTTGPSAQL